MAEELKSFASFSICPKCGNKSEFTTQQPAAHNRHKPPKNGSEIRACGRMKCSHIFALDAGKSRNLTRAERKFLQRPVIARLTRKYLKEQGRKVPRFLQAKKKIK